MRPIDADELYTLESHTQIGCDKIHGIQPRSTYQEMYEWGWNNALKAAAKGMPTIERNEKYNEMIKELLELEEQTKHFYLTSAERLKFQIYVEERLGI